MDQRVMRGSLAEAIRDTELLLDRLKELATQLDGTETVQVPGQGPWTKEMLERLSPEIQHLPGVIALFSTCANESDRTVTYGQVLAASGLEPMQQRNEHARLSRITAGLFGQKRWPVQAWQGSAPAPGETAEMLYRMPRRVARWWGDILGDQ